MPGLRLWSGRIQRSASTYGFRRLIGVTTVNSGSSIVTSSWDSAGQLIVPHSNRLNCTGISPVADNPTPDRYFVREAFSNTLAGQFGNCGRNNLIAPSQWNLDFSTLKDFKFNEKHALQFRMEMFNAPNHPALGRPSASWGSSNVNPATHSAGSAAPASYARFSSR